MEKLTFNKEKIGWMFYDFANQSFVTVIVTVLFSMYFKDVIVGQEELGTALWGRAISISLFLVVLIAPLIGTMADFSNSRKLLLMIVTYTSIIFTVLLYFVKPGAVAMTMIIFIIAKFCYTIGTVFYNSFLPDIVEKHEIGRFSGLSWGIGYLGGLFSLLVVMPIIKLRLSDYLNYRYSFVVVAFIFTVFSIPTFVWLKERNRQKFERVNYLVVGLKRLLNTAKNIKCYKELTKFLFSYFLFNNGIFVVISYASIYGSTQFDMTAMDMITYFIIAQPSSFLGATIFGYIFDKIGAKKSIIITLILWILVIIGAYFCINKYQFYVVGIGAGFALGSSQSCSRTFLALLTPSQKTAEFFGFYSVVGSFATILGLLFYGEISRITGDQKNAILSILLFFALGFIMMLFVDDKLHISNT